jgi:hypothetical protein
LKDLFGEVIKYDRREYNKNYNKTRRRPTSNFHLSEEMVNELRERARKARTSITDLVMKYIEWGFMTEDGDT